MLMIRNLVQKYSTSLQKPKTHKPVAYQSLAVCLWHSNLIPSHVILFFITTGSLTYAELDDVTDRLSKFLRLKGVVPDSCVGIYMDKSLEYVISYVAILKAGQRVKYLQYLVWRGLSIGKLRGILGLIFAKIHRKVVFKLGRFISKSFAQCLYCTIMGVAKWEQDLWWLSFFVKV